MRRYISVTLFSLMALTSCATPTLQQRKILDSMIGKTDIDVLRTFGVPSRTYDASGHNFLAYIDNQTEYSPGFSDWGWGFGGGPWGGGWGYGGPWGGMYSPPSVYHVTCQTTFELTQGRVISWTMRGDGC